MLEWLNIGFQVIKAAGAYVPIAGLLGSSALLFIPDEWLNRISLLAFKTMHSETIGLAFLVSAIATLIQLALWFKNDLWDEFWFRKNMEKQLHELTPPEKQIMCGYVLNQTRTQYFPLSDGIITGLGKAGILYRPNGAGEYMRYPCNIHPWAYKYLIQNEHLILEGVPRHESGGILPYQSDADPLKGMF